MTEIRFFPLDVGYKTKEGKSYVYLYGRTVEGRQVCVVEAFEPYFYVLGEGDLGLLRKEIERTRAEYKGREVAVSRTEEAEKSYLNQTVKLIKVFTGITEGRGALRRELGRKGMRCFEYDISYVFQYLRDKEIIPMALVRAEGEEREEKNKVPVFYADKVEQESSEMIEELRVLSFDIETYAKERAIVPEKNPILMMGFYGEREGKPFKKVITWKRFKNSLDYVEFVDSEEGLIRRFKEVVEKYRPDILTGYFSDGFDLPYLEKRAEVYGIRLDLGKDYSELILNRREESKARFTGLVHLDIFKFVRNVTSRGMETESLSLGAVAKELLGHDKYGVELNGLAEVWDERPEELEEFCKYNLQDAYMTYELAVKLMPSLLELVKLIGLPVFETSRMGFSRLVENYILRRSREFNILALNKPDYREAEWRRGQTYEGGFVYEPEPGIYEKLVVFDFRSLYPTIIAAHNIGPDTLNCKCCRGEGKVPGENYWYCKKKKGFFSRIVEDLISRRMRVKEMIKAKKEKGEESTLLEARSYGLKTVANAFYGYMAFFAARWYCLECVRSITAYARNYIKETMKKAEKKGFKVIYGDTDSLIILLGKKGEEEAQEFLKEINASLPELMELEYEGFYPRGLFVPVKSGAYGAKKKYALFDGERLKVTGFELVRRNWSRIGRETQNKVLKIVLEENNKEKALAYVRGVIDKIKNKEVRLDKMVLRTQLTKQVESYEAVGPHVAVAKKLIARGYEIVPGTVISFVVGEGSGLIRDRARPVEDVEEGEYDADYYIKNQVIPAVSSIFEVLGISEEELLKKKSQKMLGDF